MQRGSEIAELGTDLKCNNAGLLVETLHLGSLGCCTRNVQASAKKKKRKKNHSCLPTLHKWGGRNFGGIQW